MIRYIVKRLLLLIPTLLAIIFIVFAIMSFTPNTPGAVILGMRATPEAVQELNDELGYNRPMVVRYVDYVINLFQGDLGESYISSRPVAEEIIRTLPVTVNLAAVSILLAVGIGVPLGIIAAVKQYSVFDVVGTSISMFMAAMPSFWFGMMAILVFGLMLEVLPSHGLASWKHYILPSFTLAIPVAASILRLTRTTMLETIRQDYIRTARAKGQIERKIIFRHALKNAMLPVLTYAGINFGWLLGGAIVIEQVFSINGVGKLIVEAIRMKDVPQVTGCAVVLALFFMVVMLVVDILYALIDPRIKSRYQRS